METQKKKASLSGVFGVLTRFGQIGCGLGLSTVIKSRKQGGGVSEDRIGVLRLESLPKNIGLSCFVEFFSVLLAFFSKPFLDQPRLIY